MKYKIIKIKRRNFLARMFSVNEWAVTIVNEGGKEYKFNCWAGTGTPRPENLRWHLEKQINKHIKGTVEPRPGVQDLVGEIL